MVQVNSESRTRSASGQRALRTPGTAHVARTPGISRRRPGGKSSSLSRTSCSPTKLMSALRLATSVARRAPRNLVLGRRGYAEAADKISLSLVLPHQVCASSSFAPGQPLTLNASSRPSSPLPMSSR